MRPQQKLTESNTLVGMTWYQSSSEERFDSVKFRPLSETLGRRHIKHVQYLRAR